MKHTMRGDTYEDLEWKIKVLADVARLGFEDDLRRVMEIRGITGKELARRLGVSSAYVSKVLNGTGNTNYSLETVAKFSRAVGAVPWIRLTVDGKEVVRVLDNASAKGVAGR